MGREQKMDIFWCLTHRTLPLGCKLAHVSPTENGECPHCQGTPQTIEHFASEYNLSRRIWNILYTRISLSGNIPPPNSLDEILQLSNITEPKIRPAIRRLHVFGIYEIWLYYTQSKWGSSVIPELAIPFITRNWLVKALGILWRTEQGNNKEKRSILEHINM
ncbi:13736_t:CDS:1 [Dentiscutata erythropus]|uniref:13736_t:CDS:1 n=1 Tax=Dentiscutata erythropus TaxID=1348616 RepID=A0A9N9B3Z9_9GLOM|nr:13736_t:CDS:1 [Dentiscutata erythropus]